MVIIQTLVALAVLTALSMADDTVSTAFIDSINQKQTTWKAGKNFPENTTEEHLRRLVGTLGIHPDPYHKVELKKHVLLEEYPEAFDARETWPFCESLRDIRNQGSCGSCWAFGAVETMTDRLCIHSEGKTEFRFSPEDLVSCCKNCGDGCNGGHILPAWEFWNKEGLVSGGDFSSNEGCRPYTAANNGRTPQCEKSCRDGYNTSYIDDKRFGAKVYQLASSVEQMQHELMTSGPIQTMFMVYQDFYNYRSGIYQHVEGNEVAYHSIKILGWGSENGVPYWTAANSWGRGFGENGFFRILRGQNHCNFETWMYSGLPQL